MGERLTPSDVEKIEKEIEHRKLVVRKEAIEAVKQKEIENIIYSCLNSVFDYDEKYLQEQIAKRLVSRIDEIIEIMEA